MRDQMMGLAQQMSQRETQIKSAVAEVNDFVIQKNKPAVPYENILGAVVAMNQRVARGAGLLHHFVQEAFGRRHLGRGIQVIWLKPQRLEKRTILEFRRELASALPGSAVDRSQKPAKLRDVPGVHAPR